MISNLSYNFHFICLKVYIANHTYAHSVTHECACMHIHTDYSMHNIHNRHTYIHTSIHTRVMYIQVQILVKDHYSYLGASCERCFWSSFLPPLPQPHLAPKSSTHTHTHRLTSSTHISFERKCRPARLSSNDQFVDVLTKSFRSLDLAIFVTFWDYIYILVEKGMLWLCCIFSYFLYRLQMSRRSLQFSLVLSSRGSTSNFPRAHYWLLNNLMERLIR